MARSRRRTERAEHAPAPREAKRPPAPAAPSAPSAASEPLLPTRWWRLPAWLTPPREPMSRRTFVFLLAAVWLVGSLIRMAWLFRGGWSAEPLKWDGVPLLATEDAFFFGTGVDIALNGNVHSLLRFGAADEHAIVALAWLVTKVSPFLLAEVLLYLPALLAPLIAVPAALLGRDVAGPRAGILAGLLVVVAPMFVARSAAGYFDTDLFAVAAPLFAVWLIVRLLRHGAARDGLLAALVLSALPFFYSQGGPVGAAIALVTALVLLAFYRNDAFFAPTLAVIGLTQLPLPWEARTALLVPLWFVLRRAPIPPRALRWGALALALGGFAFSPEWAAALARLRDFVGATPDVGDGAAALPDIVLGDTTRFVGEAKRLALPNFGPAVIGSSAVFIAAVLGWLVLQLRHRALLVALPLIGLGFFALMGGSRFAIYASAPAAIGVAALAGILVARLRAARLQIAAFLVLGALAAVPAISTASEAGRRSTLVHGEVEALDQLAKVVQPGDTTIAWWDWGYAIGYYAHARTLVDGGQRGDDAGLVAEVLLSPSQHGGAMLARLAVEVANRQDGAGGSVSRGLFDAVRDQIRIPQMEYLRAIADPGTVPPTPTSNVYLYLPLRMLSILPVLHQLRPHEPGNPPTRPGFTESWSARTLENPFRIETRNRHGDVIFVDEAVVRRGQAMRPLKAVYVIRGLGPTHSVTRHEHPAPPAKALSGIYLADDGVYFEVEDQHLASLYVQLYFFQNADPNLFELVYANPVARVYRLKI